MHILWSLCASQVKDRVDQIEPELVKVNASFDEWEAAITKWEEGGSSDVCTDHKRSLLRKYLDIGYGMGDCKPVLYPTVLELQGIDTERANDTIESLRRAVLNSAYKPFHWQLRAKNSTSLTQQILEECDDAAGDRRFVS